MYDAIIVGARVSGASTALLLARRGYNVLLVDRATFPSDIPHGHFIHMDGPRRLERWGLLDHVVDAGTPPIDTVTTFFGDFSLVSRDVKMDGVAFGYGPRRRVFDQILVEAAAEAGAEVREGFTVDGLTSDGDGLAGIRGRRGGSTFEERATIVVGADGRNSRVARAVGAPEYENAPALLCYFFSYWSGIPAEGLEIYDDGNRLAFAFPTNDGLFGAFIGVPVAEFQAVRGDIERHFMEAVDRFSLGERLRRGTREERFYGASDLRNYYRRPYGDGWALVGDAGYHKDPYLAYGMSDALRHAEILADAIDDGLAGRAAMSEALADYQRKRDQESQADYRENLERARLSPYPAPVLGLRAALREQPEQATRLMLARERLIPPEEFFNPENFQCIMAGAQSQAQ